MTRKQQLTVGMMNEPAQSDDGDNEVNALTGYDLRGATSMTDANNPIQWAERLTEAIQHSLDLIAVGIRDFQARQEAEQRELSAAMAANDTERVRELKWILPSIDEEIASLQNGSSSRHKLQDRVHAAINEFKSDTKPAPLDRDAVEATKHELKRLRHVFRKSGLELRLSPGVSAKAIQFAETVTGLRFDDYLKAMWRITDGSSEQYWFTDDGDAKYGLNNVFNFLPMSEALLSIWDSSTELIDEKEVEDQAEEIQPLHIRHKLWFPFAEYSGIGIVQFDGDPTPAGKYGQIIMYIHDPDTVYRCSASFIEFFRSSNDVLEEVLTADPAGVRERLVP